MVHNLAVGGREQRGIAITNLEGQINRISDHTYKVKSQNGNGEYDILKTEAGWMCSCPDHTYRNVKCKHIYAVEYSNKIRKHVEVRRIEPLVSISSCMYCSSSNIVKDGVRHNKNGDIQKYYCRECERYFSFNVGFEKMKHNPQAVTTAMQLYFSGESLRNTQRSLRLLGVKVSHQTVYNWIKKYVGLMENYIEGIKPNVGDTWRADEIWMKIRGDRKYLFALMDDETRYWIAQEVANSKYKHDARNLFNSGMKATGKTPKKMITDGLPAYRDACKKEYPLAEHIRHIKIQGDMNNNKMERLNGEIRDREKVMRGLKNTDTPILKGYQIFHNYIRPHGGLKGKTPAEACGIEIEGENKWLTLIQNASQ